MGRLYDKARWKKRRKVFLDAHPVCAACEEHGVLAPATIVDHKIPHNDNYELFFDEDNWQAMCKPCHDSKTFRQDGAFGNKAIGGHRAYGFDANGMPIDSKHHWNK